MRLVPPARHRGAGRRARRAARRAAPALRELGARARATVERALHLGALRRARRSPPTRTRCGDAARPVRHQPRAARPRGRVRGRCTSASRSSSRCSAGARTTRRPASPTPRAATATSPSARSTRSPRAGATAPSSCGTAGRVALPAAWLGARRARVPFVLWSALWAHPRTPAHLAARPLLRRIYRDADAVVGLRPARRRVRPRARGARASYVAPQAVDNAFWARAAAPAARRGAVQALFVGRDTPEKGLGGAARGLARAAWRRRRSSSSARSGPPARGGVAAPSRSRNFLRRRATFWSYRRSPTRRFREPWGLVANEAMNQHSPSSPPTPSAPPPAGSCATSATASSSRPATPAPSPPRSARLHDDPALRARLGAKAARATSPPTPTRRGPRASPAPCAARPARGLLASRATRQANATAPARCTAPCADC